jgi:flagellar biosynthesis/type III secretory pathway M-ring protein FliF/YscJ
MDSWVWILIAVAAIIVIAAVVFAFVRRRRQRRELQDWFGPESDRTRRDGEKPSGGRRRASGTRKAP